MTIKRKAAKAILYGAACSLTLTACNDSFLDKNPETDLTEKAFFATPSDLETYTNGFYGYITANYWDVPSDNVIYNEDATAYKKMRNEITPDNADTWSWTSIRNVNYMLARSGKVEGDQAEANHYIGLARMMRAKLYYDKVLLYSDVPWYDRDLQTSDEELLYKGKDSRKDVVDKIMEDLEFAATHMKAKTSRTLWDKYGALAMQARIALSEGSWRKYHSELELKDADRFFQTAADACKEIMDSKQFAISTEADGEVPAYEALFNGTNLANNKEMIFFEKYSKELGRKNNTQSAYNWTSALSRDLMEDYLVIDGNKTKTYQSVDGYQTKPSYDIFDGRDPRLKQTFIYPGFTRPGDTEPSRQKISLGGYAQIKYSPRTSDQIGWNNSYTDLPVIRYAEVLLMYAEAKAELGTLTQADVDNTINQLRDRVGMPHASLSDWLSTVDPVQERHYPNVTGAQKGAILEVRRERRVELACEGFRYDDLMRWACGKQLAMTPEGMYIGTFNKFGGTVNYIDVTGDGKPDYALVKTEADKAKIPEADKTAYKLSIEVLEGNTFGLTEGDHGYVYMKSQKDKWNFVEPKCYYYPISTKDQVLNPNLTQVTYWK